MSSRAVLCSVLALLAACPDDDPSTPNIDAAPVDVAPGIDVVPPLFDAGPLVQTKKLDVVLLVDDSASMDGEQALLAASLPALRTALLQVPDISLQIAVVTSTVGINQNIEGAPACNSAARAIFRPGDGCLSQGSFLSDVPGDSGRVTNGVGDADTALACMVRVGVAGCGFEQPLKAVRQALDGTAGNPDFLRDDAALLVVVLSDEDDCSSKPGDALFDPTDPTFAGPLGPVESFRCTEFGVKCAEGKIKREAGSYTGCEPDLDSAYLESPASLRDFLVAQKGGDARRVAVVNIVGPPDPVQVSMTTSPNTGKPAARLSPSCDADPTNAPNIPDTAAPAVRLHAFGQQFPHHAFVAICSDFAQSMNVIAHEAFLAMGAPQ